MLEAKWGTEEAEKTLGLKHKVYLPQDYERERKPLLLLVHGKAGDANVMWIFTKLLEKFRPVVVSPQAFLPDPIGGFSWWQVGPHAENLPDEQKKQEFEFAINKLKDFIDGAPQVYNTDPKQIIAFGFSQGGALISSLSLKEPKLFNAVALLCSLLPKSAIKAFAPKEPLSKTSYFIFHGTKDEIVKFSRAEESYRDLQNMGAKVSIASDDVGHKVSAAGMKALKTWLEQQIG